MDQVRLGARKGRCVCVSARDACVGSTAAAHYLPPSLSLPVSMFLIFSLTPILFLSPSDSTGRSLTRIV